jgi:hypothetical protein
VGAFFSFFRTCDEPPLLYASVLGATLFRSVSFCKEPPCERLHRLDLCLLDPRFRLTDRLGYSGDEFDSAFSGLFDVIGVLSGYVQNVII